MPKLLSYDLRARVLAAVEGGSLVLLGGRAFRGQPGERDPLGCPSAGGGRRPAAASRRRQAFASDRGARRSDPCRPGRGLRHHASRAEGQTGAAGRPGQCRRAVALLPASQDHAQKKTAHATEQDRPDILKRRGCGYRRSRTVIPISSRTPFRREVGRHSDFKLDGAITLSRVGGEDRSVVGRGQAGWSAGRCLRRLSPDSSIR